MSVEELAELPPIAVGNTFPLDASSSVPTKSLKLLADQETGLLFLGNAFSPKELRHSHEWLTYREPEEHCSALAERVVVLCNLTKESRVAGVSWKDSGLLKSIGASGASTVTLFPRDLRPHNGSARPPWVRDSVDVQSLVSCRTTTDYSAQFDLVVARHTLEHALSWKRFLAGLAGWVKRDGHVLLEVPDCQNAIESCDYSVIWEEHVSYFTAQSLRRSLEQVGWKVIEIRRCRSEGEAILTALVQPPHRAEPLFGPVRAPADLSALRHFGKAFRGRRSLVLEALRNFKVAGGQLFVLGANHSASNFVDLFGEPGLFDGCFDDMLEKQGRFISTLRVPITAPPKSLQLSRCQVINAIHPGRAVAARERLVQTVGRDVSVKHISEFMFVETEDL